MIQISMIVLAIQTSSVNYAVLVPQACCAYRENFDNREFDVMNKLGHRANGKHGINFEDYYMCDLCSISFCNTCTRIKRRYLHHVKHVKHHSKSNPPQPIDVYLI